jgi:hypothetical protein
MMQIIQLMGWSGMSYKWAKSHCHDESVMELQESNIERWQSPNIAVEWLALLLRMREIPGSNLLPETGFGFS